MTATVKTWSPPQGLIIQPGSLLVPGRVGYVPGMLTVPAWHDGDDRPERFIVEHREEDGRTFLMRRFCFPGQPSAAAIIGPDLTEVSIPRWDLSSLTAAELDSLQVALEAQRQAGIGNPCPATVADRRALAGCGHPRAA
jgi:hypothetical protein